MSKTQRNNSQTGRIFSLLQNKVDFLYQKEHQHRISLVERTYRAVSEAPVLLSLYKVKMYLRDLGGWTLTDDHTSISCELIVNDFMTAIGLMDRIAVIAQDERHHPDLHLTDYRNLRIVLTSHDMGGLSTKDLVVARKINELPILLNNRYNGMASLPRQRQVKKIRPPFKKEPRTTK